MIDPPVASGICPRCQGTFDASFDRCPVDGRALLTVQDRERALIGRTLEGKYTVEGVLGRGGMGVVYRAVQHTFERPVAIKVLRAGLMDEPAAVRRFLQEVRSLGRVAHPNVITVFDFGKTEGGDLFLAMELLEGRTFAELLHAGPLPPAQAVALLAAVCDGLEAAHGAGLVHRDLKPGNLMVLPGPGPAGGWVKVLDFGLAKLKRISGEASITQSDVVCGTPAYMSPEQAMAQTLDARSDLYSLGVVAYELLAGRPPFRAETPLGAMLAHVHEVPAPLDQVSPGVPPALARVVARALAKTPDERPRSAADLRAALAAALVSPEGAVEPVAPVPDLPTLDSAPRVTPPAAAFTPSGASTPPPPPPTAAAAPPSIEPPTRPTRRTLRGPAAVAGIAFLGLAALVGLRPDEPAPAVASGSWPPLEAAPITAAPSETPAPTLPPSPSPSATAAPVLAPTSVPAVVRHLQVRSLPPGAEVVIDGVTRGRTPVDLPRPAGNRALRVELRRPGYETRRFMIAADDPDFLQTTLRPLPRIVTD